MFANEILPKEYIKILIICEDATDQRKWPCGHRNENFKYVNILCY